MATTAVTLAGFPLVGLTPGGGRAKVTGMDGWLAGSNDRARARKSGGHGSWSSRGWRAEKPIIVTGQIAYSTAAAAAEERRTLLALGGYGESNLIVTDALGTLMQSVEVDDIDIPPATDRLLLFTFEVTATDPFARATTPVTVSVAAGTTEDFTAAGTVAAEIEVTTTSAGTVNLSAGGLTLRWGSLPSGSVLTSGPGFTNPKRTVLGPSGENLYGLIVQPSQWPAVAPGSNSFINAGSANVDVTYYSTYA